MGYVPRIKLEEIDGEEDRWTSGRRSDARGHERSSGRTNAASPNRDIESQFIRRIAGTDSQRRISAENR